MKKSYNALVAITALSSILLLAQACSGAKPDSGFGTGNGDGGSGGDDGSVSFGDDGGVGNFGGDSGVIVGDAACAAAKSKGEQLPLDIYIMLDKSGSMNEMVAGGVTKWTAVTGALKTFVAQPSSGVSVGIQYFGLPPAGGCTPTCTTNADCGANGPCLIGICLGCTGGGGDSCNAADYAKPEIEIALLPGNAGPLTTSINAHSASTGTPTSAALQGAVDHAKAWAGAHPGHATIVVFATDGDPSSCDTNLAHIDAIAAAGVNGTPKVLTFVIGVGSSLGNLNGIAAAGGTMQAFIVDTNQNVNQQFLDALNKIRGTALGCTYKIPLPESGTPDYGTVNVQYVPGNGMPAQLIPQVANKAACPTTGNAWYYDNPNAPTQIVLCQASCTAITADTHGEVDVLTGCKTVVR